MADEVEVFARHAVQLERLKATEKRLFAEYMCEIDRIIRQTLGGVDLQSLTPVQVEAVTRSVETAVKAQVSAWSTATQASITAAAIYEADFTARALRELSVVRSVVTPDEIVRAVVDAAVYGTRDWKAGMTIKTALDSFANESAARLANEIRLGYFEGRTTTDMAAQIRGLARLNYRDGSLARLANAAETMAADTFQLATGAGKLATLEQAGIGSYRWVSVLDNRTSSQCRALDSRVFRVGKGPLPPLHPNCRSTIAPVLPKSLQGLDEAGTRNADDGPIDSGASYYQWLKTQDIGYISSVLGPTRAQLLVDGGLTPERFAALQLNRNFEPITLDRMREIDPLAFRRAGL